MAPGTCHPRSKAQLLGQRLESLRVGTRADDHGGRRPGRFDAGDRFQQDIDPLQMPEFADEDEVGGIGRRDDKREFGGPQSVRHDADIAAGLGHLGAIGSFRERTLEHDAVRQPAERALGAEEHAALRALGIEVEDAPMGRVETDYALPARSEPCRRQSRVKPALGAMAMQHVEIEALGDACHGARREDVARAGIAAHGRQMQPERELRPDRLELGGRQGIARAAIGEDADGVAARRLFLGEIEHVAEQAADGRA